MRKIYSSQNLQNASFKNQDLVNASFSNSDLRGADFTGADLTGAIFDHVKTGITPLNTILIFVGALIVSLLSGYFAMLAGQTIHEMFDSDDPNKRTAGIATIAIIILFIAYSWWKGIVGAIRYMMIPVIILAAIVGLIYYISRLGTGLGMLEQIVALLFVALMFVVGTIARVTANTLSVILFLVVALSGGMFGKSIGGGIGSVIMALATAQISKRALSGAKGFRSLRKIAGFVTARFGTSFRNAKLINVNFYDSNLHNVDFSNADISSAKWVDSKKIHCIPFERH